MLWWTRCGSTNPLVKKWIDHDYHSYRVARLKGKETLSDVTCIAPRLMFIVGRTDGIEQYPHYTTEQILSTTQGQASSDTKLILVSHMRQLPKTRGG